MDAKHRSSLLHHVNTRRATRCVCSTGQHMLLKYLEFETP